MSSQVCKTASEFNAFISYNPVTFVHFYTEQTYFNASWCNQAKAISPYLQQVTQNRGVPLALVNVEQNQEIGSKYNITALPTFSAINSKGVVVEESVGGSKHGVDNIVQAVLRR